MTRPTTLPAALGAHSPPLPPPHPPPGRGDANSPPRCPRCGYHLQGLVDTWHDACALDGVCSECGLMFAWRDVLNPRFAQPRWSVEFGPGGAGVLWRAAGTLAIIHLRPDRFWRELQMAHPLRWSRIALVLLLIVPLWYATFALSMGVTMYLEAQTLRSRLTTLSPPWNHRPWLIGVKAALLPFSSDNAIISTGARKIVSRWQDYDPIRPARAGWHAISHNTPQLRDGTTPLAQAAFVTVLSLLAAPLGFALLPMSRRIARVRWAHVGRIALYSLALAFVPILVDAADQVSNHVVRYKWTGEAAVILLVAMLALQWLWWSLATGRYLRIRHAWAVGLFVVVFAWAVHRAACETVDLALTIITGGR